MNTTTVPTELTPAMLAAMLDALEHTPFSCRRKLDKSGWEVVRADNADWREVIGDDDERTVMSEFAEREAAEAMHRELVARWVYAAVISAA